MPLGDSGDAGGLDGRPANRSEFTEEEHSGGDLLTRTIRSMRGGIKRQPDQGPRADEHVRVQSIQNEGGIMLLNPRNELLELLLTS